MKRELCNVFPNIYYFKHFKILKKQEKLSKNSKILNLQAIIINIKTKNNMLDIADKIQIERDKCLDICIEFGNYLTECIHKISLNNNKCMNIINDLLNIFDTNNSNVPIFLDLIDPMTGQAFYSKPGPSIYDEIDGGSRLLKYPITKIGKCGILSHPQWSSYFYPCTLFTNIDINKIIPYIAIYMGKN